MTHGISETCPLNERELNILQQLANGLSAKEAARLTGISYHTVNNVLALIKVRCRYQGNVTGLAVKAVRAGWIQ